MSKPDPRLPSAGVSVQFYHLTATSVERALPKLLEKALAAKQRVLVVESAAEKLDYYNQVLWTYHPAGFLPHGSIKEPYPEQQPVLLAPAIDNRNHAEILLVTDGTLADGADFRRVIDLFDGNDKTAVERARTRWKHYQNSGNELSYLRQTEAGGWEKAAA